MLHSEASQPALPPINFTGVSNPTRLATLILLVLAVLLCINTSAYAQSAPQGVLPWEQAGRNNVDIGGSSDPVTIYVVGDPGLVASALRGVSRIISPSSGSSVLLRAVQISLLISLIFAITAWFTRGQMRLIPFLGMMFLSWIMFLNTTNVRVQTYFSYSGAAIDTGKAGGTGSMTSGGTVTTIYGAGKFQVVDDVPLGLALPASIAGTITTAIADVFAVSFQNPTVTNYSEGSFGFVDPLKTLLQLRSSNPCAEGNICRSIFEYMRYCIARPDANGALQTINMAQVVTRPDALKYLLEDINTGAFANLPSSTHYFPTGSGLTVGAGEMKSCAEAGQRIHTDILNFENSSGLSAMLGRGSVSASPGTNETTSAAPTNAPTNKPTEALQQLTGGLLTDAASITAQLRFWPMVQAGLLASNEPIDRATALAFTLIRDGVEKWQVDGAGEGSIWVRGMFTVMNIFLFVIICMTPVIFLMASAMMMQGFVLIKEYIIAVIWTQTWFPTAVVINYYITETISQQVQSYRFGTAGGIFAPAAHGAFYDSLATAIASAGWMMGAVPLISYALLRGSTQAMTQLASRAAGTGGSGYTDESKASPAIDQAINARAMTDSASLYGGSMAGVGIGGSLGNASVFQGNSSSLNAGTARSDAAVASEAAAKTAMTNEGFALNAASAVGSRFSAGSNAADKFSTGLSADQQSQISSISSFLQGITRNKDLSNALATTYVAAAGMSGAAAAGAALGANGAKLVRDIAGKHNVQMGETEASSLATQIAQNASASGMSSKGWSASGAIQTLGASEKAFGQDFSSKQEFSGMRQAQSQLQHSEVQSSQASAMRSAGSNAAVTDGNVASLVTASTASPDQLRNSAQNSVAATGVDPAALSGSMSRLNTLTGAAAQTNGGNQRLALASAVMEMGQSNSATDRAVAGAVLASAASTANTNNNPALRQIATTAGNVGSALVEANTGAGAAAVAAVPAAIAAAQGDISDQQAAVKASGAKVGNRATSGISAGRQTVAGNVAGVATNAQAMVQGNQSAVDSSPVKPLSASEVVNANQAQATQIANQALTTAGQGAAKLADAAQVGSPMPAPNIGVPAGTRMSSFDGLSGQSLANAETNAVLAGGATRLLSGNVTPNSGPLRMASRADDVGRDAMQEIFQKGESPKTIQSAAYATMAQNFGGARAGDPTALGNFQKASVQAYAAEVALSGQAYSPSLAGQLGTNEGSAKLLSAVNVRAQSAQIGATPMGNEEAMQMYVRAAAGLSPSPVAPQGGGSGAPGKSEVALNPEPPIAAPSVFNRNGPVGSVSRGQVKDGLDAARANYQAAYQQLEAGVAAIYVEQDAGRITTAAATQRVDDLERELKLNEKLAAYSATHTRAGLPSSEFATGLSIAGNVLGGGMIGGVARGVTAMRSLQAARAADTAKTAAAAARRPLLTGSGSVPGQTPLAAERAVLLKSTARGAAEGATVGVAAPMVAREIDQALSPQHRTARPTTPKPLDAELQKMSAAAAGRVGIPVGVMDSIIRAESGGKLAIKPLTAAAGGSARGQTQFIESTWIDQAQRTGTYLNRVAKEKDFVNDRNQIYEGKRTDLLALRDDPRTSVEAAADYAGANLAALRAANLPGIGDLSQLNNTQVAQYAYVLHMAGPGDGMALIRDGQVPGGNDRAANLLAAQFGGKETAAYKRYMDATGGDAQRAFRNFVTNHATRNAG